MRLINCELMKIEEVSALVDMSILRCSSLQQKLIATSGGDMSVNISTAETSVQSENCFIFANINTEHIIG